MAPVMDLFRVRLNNIDHYQAIPTRFDPILRSNVKPSQLQKEPKVPVIRVFGATETGQKVCVHIHGAFPYLYVEYEGQLDPDEVGAYIHRLHMSIDYALAVSYRRNTYDGNAKYVARITLVKGIPFYGFHVGYKFFLKIYMLNPIVMTRLSDLLRQGAILRKVFQPYEAHLQYLLQWMADYNLYGCGFIDAKSVSFRSPVPSYSEVSHLSHLWHDQSISGDIVTDESTLPRVSHCAIEVDMCVQDILNRHDIKARPLHHDFIERLNPLAPSEKLVHSMAGLWKDETRRRRARLPTPNQAISPFPPEVLVSMSADPRNSQPGGWIHEAEYRERIESLVEEERMYHDGSRLSFKNFITPSPFEASIRSSLDSVEDLYPENLDLTSGDGSDHDHDIPPIGVEDHGVADVDEDRILGISKNGEAEEAMYESDEEVMREMQLSQFGKGDKLEEKKESLEGGHNQEANMEESFSQESKSEVTGAMSLVTNSDHLPGSSKGDSTSSFEGLDDSQDREPRMCSRSSMDQPSNSNKRRKLNVEGESIVPEKRTEHSQPAFLLAANSSTPSHHPMQIGASFKTSQFKHIGGPKWLTPNLTTGPSFQDTPRDTTPSSIRPIPFPVIKQSSQTNTLRVIQNLGKEHNPFVRSMSTYKAHESGPNLQSSVMEPTLNSSSSPMTTVLENMRRDFKALGRGKTLMLSDPPPLHPQRNPSMQVAEPLLAIYQDAYYSNEDDVPERAREWAGREFKLESLTVPFLPDFDPTGTSAATFGEKSTVVVDKSKEDSMYNWQRSQCTFRSWTIADPPPTYKSVLQWSRKEIRKRVEKPLLKSKTTQTPRPKHIKGKVPQIDGPTQKNKHGFKYTQNQKTKSIKRGAQYMSTMSLEIHVNTRGSFVPNPEEDEVQCLFWCLQSDDSGNDKEADENGLTAGIVILSEDGSLAEKVTKQVAIEVQEECSELDLMIRMVDVVRTHDPDILTGYEVHSGSWGYLIERARLKYEYNLCDEFSRMKTESHGRFGKDNDKWGFNNTSIIRVTGRHMINIWRAMRSELNLLQYTMENVVFHLLHRRVPHYPWIDLTQWYKSEKPRELAKILNYYISRVNLDLEILEQNELIPRTSEQARLLGVDFFSVFSRGSQFKVESIMFRLAKPEQFMLVSPSRKQVGGQNALECLPLVMEPQSGFYNSPLLVLDFQSLYPSVMIAYNYCYSTFLGRVVNWRGTNKMGFTEFTRQERLLELLKDHVNIAPNGMMYTKPEIRKSLLAKMLGEILETRVMVKSGMKVDRDDKALQRLLNNRQLALKLIANVTYGYTSASFSGRMPCSEIADSIVQTGRETLEKAIALIHSVKRWGAEVVYGDTDSLFVYLKGRTKDQAFDIGEEIAKTVTNMNPRPIKLKFEKVYLPCVLLAKKRYVGFKYESRGQTEPDFDAKGIETVRRDGTPAEQKIEERALKILFRTSDLSQVKEYFQQQCEKIMKGTVSVQDFCFAREVKLGTYSVKGPPPPGALISTKRMLEDARAEPQYGERVPYVVITGGPGARLIDRCVPPEELLQSDHHELDAEYYISKNLIPPLERIFNLVGANVRNWYDEMPKVKRIRRVDVKGQFDVQTKEVAISKKSLESYMKSALCLVCREKLELEGPICPKCLADKPNAVLTLRKKLSSAVRTVLDLRKICQSCSGLSPLDDVRCDSKDCPVFYTRTREETQLKTEKAVLEPVTNDLSRLILSPDELDW